MNREIIKHSTLCTRNLTLNNEKCTFGMHKLVFMGRILSKNDIEPSDNKVEAANGVKRHKNVAEVKSFQGLLGYCGRYIEKKFSH